MKKKVDELSEKAKAGQVRTAEALKQAEEGKKRRNMQSLKLVDAVAFNRWAEEEFIGITRELMGENPHTRVQVSEVVREVAYELKISPETVKRYILKHTARRAEFRQHDGWMFLNPKFEPMEEDDDEDPS
jgi:hypothetical protein